MRVAIVDFKIVSDFLELIKKGISYFFLGIRTNLLRFMISAIEENAQASVAELSRLFAFF